ncbi:uroporphyrinogen-III synthase [Litorisediminicola beolgyonensis]|uniref:Uroporphyrinogen-III synthase n=1 Tax=Litorisediminicola beolgyonensis TaxID=1173614 RepID=A0ABW3ZIM5_9RHOB
MPRPPILLMTRPEPQSRAFVESLGVEVDVVISPLIGIAPVGPLPDPGRFAGLILTSANAARIYGEIDGTKGLTAWCVGARTADAAREAGLEAEALGGDAAALTESLIARNVPGPLLHLRGFHSRGAVADRLIEAGIETHEAVIYDQPAQPLTPGARAALDGDRPVIAPLFSPRTAEVFALYEPFDGSVHVVAMSAAVAEAVEGLPLAGLEIAASPTGADMAETVLRLLSRLAALETPEGGQ